MFKKKSKTKDESPSPKPSPKQAPQASATLAASPKRAPSPPPPLNASAPPPGPLEKSVSHAARVEAAKLLIDAPQQKLDIPTCRLALGHCEAKGKWELAVALLIEMEAHELTPDGLSFACAIRACRAARRDDIAKVCEGEAARRSVTVDMTKPTASSNPLAFLQLATCCG